jgi:hypothetical protein
MLIYLSVDLSLCPPNSAGVELRKIIKQIRDGEFKYEGREPAEINWTQYDQAQIYEMANYLDNIRDLVDEADRRLKERMQPKKRVPGRSSTNPPISPRLCYYKRTRNRLIE